MLHRVGWSRRGWPGTGADVAVGSGRRWALWCWWGWLGWWGWWGRGLLLFGDAGGVEGGDVAQRAGGALDQGQGEQGAGALAEAQAKVHQRVQPEAIQGQGVPGLDAAVAREAGRGDVGGESGRGQRGGAGDDPVQDDRDAQRGGAKDDPGQGGVLEAAERGEHAHRVGRIGAGAGP